MNPSAYLEMDKTESAHWWFLGRRVILSKIIESLNLPQKSKILEIGCGTGGNLQMLSQFGETSAIEMNEKARIIALKKTGNLYDIRSGYCPDEIPLFSHRFDLVCMFDVLEHIEQDIKTLINISQLLTENGRIIITVPAYRWLYGPHDIFLHHKRRYSEKQLRNISLSAGYRIERISYFNTVLFFFVVIVRLKDRLKNKLSSTGAVIPSTLINKILKGLFSFERFLLERLNLPFGISLVCILGVAKNVRKSSLSTIEKVSPNNFGSKINNPHIRKRDYAGSVQTQ